MKEGTKVELLTSLCGFEKGDIGYVVNRDNVTNLPRHWVLVIINNRTSHSYYTPYVAFHPVDLKVLNTLKEFLGD